MERRGALGQRSGLARLLVLSVGLMLLSVTSAPHAEGLDMAALEVMLEQEMFRVEAVMGRQAIETPTLRVATYEEFLASMVEATRLRDPTLSADRGALAAEERALRAQTERSLALYTGHDGAITLLSDRLPEKINELGRMSALAALRCVMDHELAHALQDQWVNNDPNRPFDAEDHELVVEGQATWVSSQLCDDITARESVLGGLSARAKMSPGEESYALGWWFMDSLVARWGVEATWAALENPPERDAVRALFNDAPVEKMPNFNAHIRVLARARLGGLEKAQMHSRATITDVLLWETLRGPAVHTPGGDLGRVSVEIFSTYADTFVPARVAVTTVGWYHIRDPSAGRRWLEKRCAALTGDRSGVSIVGSMTPDAMLVIDESAELVNAPFIDLEKLAPDAQARCAVTGNLAGVNYAEMWVLQDNTLRMIAQTYTGPPVKKPKALIKAFTVYLRKSKSDPSREQAFTAGLEGLVTVREGAAATPSWTRHVSRGYYDLYRRRWSSCVSRAQQVLLNAPVASKGQGAWLIYYCGTMSDDAELAKTAVELVRHDYDLRSLAAGLDEYLRERGEDELARQFMARHCVEFKGEDPSCGR